MSSASGSTENATGPRPRVYIDTDVLLAAAGSTEGASHLIVKLSELTLIEGVISEAVRVEAERNLWAKLPHAVPAYRALLKSAKLWEVSLPSAGDLQAYRGQADPKDLVHLAAACLSGCHILATHNTRDYAPPPDVIDVLTPGDLLTRVRRQLAMLAGSSERGEA